LLLQGLFRFSHQFPRKDSRNSHKYSTPLVEIPNAIPQIISPEDWSIVQDMMNVRRYSARTLENSYLLSGRIRCVCGGPMSGSRSKSRKGDYYEYYKCNSSHSSKSCGVSRIKKEWIEEPVMAELWQIFTRKSLKKRFVKLITERSSEGRKEQNSLIAGLELKAQALEKKLATFTEAIAGGATYLAKEAQSIHNQIESLQTEISIQKYRIGQTNFSEIEKNIDDLFDKIKKSPEQNRALVTSMLDYVEVSNDDVKIYLKKPKVFGANCGGGEGSRTPVQRYSHNVFSERSLFLKISDFH